MGDFEKIPSKTLYCGRIYVSDKWLTHYFHPDEWHWVSVGPTPIWEWSSPVLADRYSARNWVYCRLRESFLRKIPIEAFVSQGLYGCHFAVDELSEPIPSEIANHWIGKDPMQVGFETSRLRQDLQFMLQYGGVLWPSTNTPLPHELSLPLLIDSFFDTAACMGENYGRLGPAEPIFKLKDDADREDLRDRICTLTKAAVTRREWTIPDGAIVDNNTLQFPYVQLNETDNVVSFVFAKVLSTSAWASTVTQVAGTTSMSSCTAQKIRRVDSMLPRPITS